MSQRDGGGALGCLGTIAFAILLWAIFFGVTVGGRHYQMVCSCRDGVRFDQQDRR